MNVKPRRIWLLIASLLVLIVAVGIGIINRPETSPETDTAQTPSGEEKAQQSSGEQTVYSENLRLSKNISRKNDAQSLATSVANYINNNSGNLPTSWQNNYLVGGGGTSSVQTELTVYHEVLVAEAPQPALTTDSIRIVRHGLCGGDGSASRGNTITGYVVQYSQLVGLSSGAVEGGCIDM